MPTPRHPLKVSISGVRGIVGSSLTPEVACKFAQTFGTYVGGGNVIVGRDPRPSGIMIQQAVHAGLLAAGCRPIDIGIQPTPTILMNVKHRHANGGIAITASHNPNEWNALKFVNKDGIFLNKIQAAELLDAYNQDSFKCVENSLLKSVRHESSAFAIHQEAIDRIIDIDTIRRAGLHVAVDCCNGAASAFSKPFLEHLGCKCHALFDDNSGIFPHPPEPTPQHISDLCRYVVETNSDIGFVQDPDADRLVLVDETGTPINEDYTLTLVTKYLLKKYQGNQTVVANLAITKAFGDVAQQAGARCIYTPIGEINVTEEILANNALVGGEGNGGVIMPAVHPCRDSFTGMALILEAMASEGKKLSELLKEIPQYTMLKTKLTMSAAEAHRVIDLYKRHNWGDDVTINTCDGLRIDWKDKWALIRTSNTEPIIRFAAEAVDRQTAEELINTLYQMIGVNA